MQSAVLAPGLGFVADDEHQVYVSFSRIVEEFAQNLCCGPVAL